MSKTWEKPKLVVLVRGEPEENLIIVCKHFDLNPGGPNAEASACYSGTASCFACVTYTAS